MKRSEGRFLTSHVGSIIRPTSLLDADVRAKDDPTQADAYEQELTADVTGVVKSQIDAGLDVVNDGEYGKSSWSAYVLDRITGFEIRKDQLKPLVWLGRDIERFPDFFRDGDMPAALTGAPAEVCVGPIKYTDDHTEIDRDLANLAVAAADPAVTASGAELFFTSVAPASTAYQGINEYYKTDEEYIFAIAEALRVEYLAVIEAGFILQVDDAVFANMYDHLIEQGRDVWETWAQLRVDALNHALEGISPDRVRYHICYGSWHVPHVADAPFSEVVNYMLQVNAGAYSIEAANPRHEHEWDVWETVKLPDDKILIPGVVTHHTTTVEHPELVARRLERYAALFGPEQVIGGTDCGFAQNERTQRVHPEVMWAKYRTLAEGARIASERTKWS
jgi:5-methyltetrahydropteroyltriglutamate--homocysteine methyltransferase